MTDENVPLKEEMEPQTSTENAGEKNWAEEALKFQDLYLRCAAETENMRRRFQKERAEQARFAAEKILRGLLPVLDNLTLALSYVKADSRAETLSLADGVRLTLKGLLDVLNENGLKVVPAERGQIFDPNLHEAIGQAPETEIPAGSISQEVQPGYSLYERLIRPAKVIVAAAVNPT
ncbi:MAG: hypothetical protein AMR96_02665 [Candidatus Adiutrix intracellularis]|jgi:molecular chaperone GrpE|nr:MAG: hypothetical protein AMR96_02665 [Candidatus Adiutrix intracellularis]MDR2826853.1 nucleotide exchange factor GrpE [Candidatus Adiutrix intracellularis]